MSTGIEPGDTFGVYRIDELLSRGGMGVVYRATDLSLDRPAALKLIAPELAQDELFRARFLKEPRLAASLDHPNVVPIYEAGERDGQFYVAMRYVDGSDLKSLLTRDGKLSPERTIAILSQVAGALDAAHRRGLVHRDVKPANVLLDEDGHAYLTDFGITKRVGAAATDTGQLIGTIGYSAPEQIRGENVSGRSDVYSLACVLYECLAGAQPFRRDTEGATMWAHMQDPPPPLRGHAKLDPVLAKGLAKDPGDRYPTCGELIEDAAKALGLSAPARRVVVPPAIARRRRAILVAGLAVLAVSIAALLLTQTGGDGDEAPLANGVAALDPSSGSITAQTRSRSVPGNVAVGEGAVWVLNGQDDSVSRLDPETKEVTKTFKPGGLPTEIAAGEGAVWVGNAGGRDGTNATVSIAQIDPRTTKVTRTVRLPGGEGEVLPVAGAPRLAVGAGAVWAINPDESISRIDPETGRRVARIDIEQGALTIAAGREGVWLVSESSVLRIDPRTNRVTETIQAGGQTLWGVAVGAGSVWATARDTGLLWRIEPGPDPVTRSIDVGVGTTFVAFGEGAVWTGNYVDGRVSRLDPRTNRITARTAAGTPQSLAAGAGAVWVSVAGGSNRNELTIPACGEVASGGQKPDVLVASDLPLQGALSTDPRGVANAVRYVLERRGFRAGEHTVGYQSCDVSTAETGGFEFRKCAANATAYGQAERLVAVIGTWSSYCAEVQIPILNRASGGPVPMISPTNTGSGLTRGGPLSEGRGQPGIFYPTGERNYARVVPREDLQGRAQALLARRLGLKRVAVVSSDEEWERLVADPFADTARRLGLAVTGSYTFGPEEKSQDELADRIARSRAQGVLFTGFIQDGSYRVIEALRSRLGTRIKIMFTDISAPVPYLLDEMGSTIRGAYMTSTDMPPVERALTPAGRRFARDFGALESPTVYVLPAAQAAEVVMDAIARSDGTRASVLRELQAAKVEDGILGSFRFDRGDITPARVAVFRVTGRTPPQAAIPELFQGAVLDRVVTVPPELDP
jgi:ABC-type branched-subunit amino acid transport system substrate-binding protein/DNA-binding beta-propeller fold protein YncE